MIFTYRVPTLICVGKHNICVGNCEIILIGNRKIKRPRICHDFKTANFNSREFKWGYSISKTSQVRVFMNIGVYI